MIAFCSLSQISQETNSIGRPDPLVKYYARNWSLVFTRATPTLVLLAYDPSSPAPRIRLSTRLLSRDEKEVPRIKNRLGTLALGFRRIPQESGASSCESTGVYLSEDAAIHLKLLSRG